MREMFFFRKRLKKSTPEDEEKLAQAFEENQVGFKDRIAMVLSAFLVIVLPCVLILCAFAGIFFWLFSLLG